MSPQHTPTNPAFSEAQHIVDDAWQELQRGLHVQQRLDPANARLPEVSLRETERRSQVGHSLLQRLKSLDWSNLPHDLELTLRLVRFRADTWSKEAQRYWAAVDPRGIGALGMFLPTAYCGGYLLNFAHSRLASFLFKEPGDGERCLQWLQDYARLVEQFTARTAGQAERGVRMPKVQVLQARTLLGGFKAGAHAVVSELLARLDSDSKRRWAQKIESGLVSGLQPAFDRALSDLSEEYLQQAPDTVGLGQYPGGEALYAEIVKYHTTLDLTSEQVHARGLERMEEIEAAIGQIQVELGFEGDREGFVAHLNNDPRWRESTPEGVERVFQRYIDRLRPHLASSFAALPRASYGITRLPEALQGSMTYGFYDPPRKDRDEGFYVFNSGNLTRQPLFHIASLTYHELMPGHHLQLAGQQENQTLHPFRQHSFVNAYIEGWAEYAATFTGEIGMYELPEERYGRLVMDAFLTSRLVVDTGMNALGWSLERAREYMRQHSRLVEGEIRTESVRYSCDVPGQALAYKLGDTAILEMRATMRRVLREKFEIRKFHEAVLGAGAVPLHDLTWHVRLESERLAK